MTDAADSSETVDGIRPPPPVEPTRSFQDEKQATWADMNGVSVKSPSEEAPARETFCQALRPRKSTMLCGLLLAVIAVISIVPAVVMLPREKQSRKSNILTKTNDKNISAPVPVTESKPFLYGQDPIRGINLGGWLVLEPFITPSLFEDMDVSDEWHLCEALGPEEAKRRLENHYQTFITEDDIRQIAEMGFNHVRIPIGHWAIKTYPGEPFVPNISWNYFIKGLEWARRYGLKVMAELHTAPGSQNGWNHSGRAGKIGWLDGTLEGEINGNRTIQLADAMVRALDRPEWSDVVTIIGVLNEPGMIRLPQAPVKAWYRRAYDHLRGQGPDGTESGMATNLYLTFHDGFLGLDKWAGFFKPHYERTFLEAHLYLIFDVAFVVMPPQRQAEVPCKLWRPMIQKATESVAPIMVGEFSLATNDCGKYLNGYKLGNRYEGTMAQDGTPSNTGPVCPSCTCSTVEDWQQWDDSYKQFLQTFIEHQMDTFELGVGWFFWTYKTENHINPHWDYLLGWKQGWVPRNVNTRTISCT